MEEKLIHKQLRAIRDEVDAVGKDHQNTGVGYSYRSADDVLAAVKPLFIKHQVLVFSAFTLLRREPYTTPATSQRPNGSLLISTVLEGVWRFVAADGSAETVQTIGDGVDSADKGSGKAMTASEKYAYCQMLQITVADVRRNIEEEDYEIQAPRQYQSTTTMTHQPQKNYVPAGNSVAGAPARKAASAPVRITATALTPQSAPGTKGRPRLITKEEYEELMTYAAQFGFDRSSAHAFLLKTFKESDGLENHNFKHVFNEDMFAEAKVKFFQVAQAEGKA